MPFDTPHRQVVPSVPSASDRRRTSKLAGCAGVLFQIFHGKRLFPRKSLPAERPKQIASIHTEDKLPIAKLLLIADENRSSPLESTDEEGEVQSVVQVGACEEKVAQRAPGVVARLMGLETMPYPESASTERKQSEQHKDMELHLDKDRSKQDKLTSIEVPIQPYNSSRRVRTKEFKTDLPARFAAHQRAKVQDDIAKLKVLTKGSSVSPHYLDASFPSGLSYAKVEPFSKSSMCPWKAVHLLEAEPKTLQESTQPNHQIRSQQPQISSLRNRIGSNAVKDYRGQSGREKTLTGSKGQPETYAVHESGIKSDEIKAPHVGPRHTSTDLVRTRQTLDYQKPHLAGSRKCSPHEVTLVKRKHGVQGVVGEAKASMAEKVKPDWRQQQETSRRLSQPTNPSASKTQRNRLTRHPSPPKSVQDSSASALSQASNWVRSSSVNTLTSRVIKSQIGSNNIAAEQLSSSSIRGSIGKPGGVSCFRQSTTSDLSQSVELENSQFSQDGSSSSAIYTESLQRSSMESSISSDPSVSEFNTSSDECLKDSLRECITGYEREEKRQEDNFYKLHDVKRLSDSFLIESLTDSLSDSLALSLDDTASSQSQLDPSAKAYGSPHSYSGRNTAAILQELLTALSSSSSQRKITESCDKHSDVTEFSSLGPDLKQLEKSQNFSARYGQYDNNLSMDSTFQGSASSASADTSQHSQANDDCEKVDSFTSKDSPSSEMQLEDECHLETAHPGQTQMQHVSIREHADFADCEALMNAISKMHHIDPEAIGLNVRAAKHQEKALLNVLPGDGLFAGLVDSDKLDCEQTHESNLGISSSTTLMPEDDADSIYRSDFESSFRIGHDEDVTWNKKLITDCINEAFKSLSKQLYKFSSSITDHSSANHVLSRVYKQLDEWKAMATNMNLDDMIEKELNITTRSWRNIGNETEEVTEALESSILSGLLEEMLLELM